jgi:hypothetical protein
MPEEKSWGQRLKDIARWIGNRVSEVVYDKAGPQGAAELSQALFNQSNAYVPYGHAQQPLEVEGPAVSYQQMLKDASQRAVPDQGKEIER